MSTYQFLPVNNRPPQIADLGIFADMLFDPDDSSPIYVGLHLTNGASQSDPFWKIYKFTYVSGNVTRIQMAFGVWTSRATLFP